MEKLKYVPCFILLSEIYLEIDLINRQCLLITKAKNISAPLPLLYIVYTLP